MKKGPTLNFNLLTLNLNQSCRNGGDLWVLLNLEGADCVRHITASTPRFENLTTLLWTREHVRTFVNGDLSKLITAHWKPLSISILILVQQSGSNFLIVIILLWLVGVLSLILLWFWNFKHGGSPKAGFLAKNKNTQKKKMSDSSSKREVPKLFFQSQFKM